MGASRVAVRRSEWARSWSSIDLCLCNPPSRGFLENELAGSLFCLVWDQTRSWHQRIFLGRALADGYGQTRRACGSTTASFRARFMITAAFAKDAEALRT